MNSRIHVSAQRTERVYTRSRDSVAVVMDGETFTIAAISVLDGGRQLPVTYDTLKIPVTGPVRIDGVRAGDRVRIDILDIEIAPEGAMVTLPGHGMFGDRVAVAGRIVPITDGEAVLSADVRVPISPMVGKVALAPADGTPSSSTVGDYGGNMDNRKLGAGASIYLRAEVDGGQLYVGDLHACQADGESSLTAVEVAGVVTLRVVKVPAIPTGLPVVITPGEVMTIGSGATFEEAAKQAADAMLTLLHEMRGWPIEKAAMALSLMGEVGVCQLVNPRASARMTIPDRYLPELRLVAP